MEKVVLLFEFGRFSQVAWTYPGKDNIRVVHNWDNALGTASLSGRNQGMIPSLASKSDVGWASYQKQRSVNPTQDLFYPSPAQRELRIKFLRYVWRHAASEIKKAIGSSFEVHSLKIVLLCMDFSGDLTNDLYQAGWPQYCPIEFVRELDAIVSAWAIDNVTKPEEEALFVNFGEIDTVSSLEPRYACNCC